MKNRGFSFKAGTLCVLAIAGATGLPTNVFADEVTLKSADGTVNLTGEFIAFEDNSYTVRTPLGDLRIAASRVTCEGAACPTFEVESADIQIAGSNAFGVGLMPLLLEGFAVSKDAAATMNNLEDGRTMVAELVADAGYGDEIGSFLVVSDGSNDAFANLLSGEAQIGMSSRRIRPDEARALRDAGGGMMIDPGQEHLIALDSLVVIVNPDNPVQSISLKDLGGIYSGEITNWSQLGGADAPITVVGRQEDSGTSALFYRNILGPSDDWRFSDDLQVARNNNEAASMVAEDVNAISFVGYAFQRGNRPVTIINDCGIAMTPNAFAARTEEYGLQQRMYLYNRADVDKAEVREFLAYAASPAADSVIAKSGFIGLAIDRQEQSMESPRAQLLQDPNADVYEARFMQDMLSTMVGYDRLSTTFRFRTGSSTLDERGRFDMQRLADYLRTNDPEAEVVFVGFTDNVGAFDSNLELSKERAAKVMQDFRDYIGDDLPNLQTASMGYGAIAPSGCNAQDDGRRINRRVEVWIKSPGQAG